ncbi:MAG: N-acetylglucosamine-6-phosphate deacetylase [Planctomycetota bacterium]
MAIPGFVDLQVNGFIGVDFSDPGLHEKDFCKTCREVLRRGTSAFLPTMITSPVDVYERNLPLLAQTVTEPEFAARLLGIHLEGPFISRQPGAVGSHNPKLVRDPDPALLDRLQELAGGHIKLLSISADVDGADALARHAVEQGITVSLGHHMADENHLERLAAAGATALTHLGNGIPNTLDRHRNPLWAGLAADDLTALIITDGHHLTPSVIKAIIRTKGVERIAVVSDAAPLAGLPPGRYRTLGNDVVLEESGRLYNPEKKCLVGSSATMLDCINHLASLGLLGEHDLIRVGFTNPLALIGVDPADVHSDSALEFDPAQRAFHIAG